MSKARHVLWQILHPRGLTLVEVLAVVVILGLLATVLTTSFGGQVARAKIELARTGIGQVVNAVELYALEQGSFPTMDQGLAILAEPVPGRGDPYLKPDQLKDPWGNHFAYVTPGPVSAYQVISYGADGQSGGEPGSHDADITSDSLGGSE